MQRLHGLLFAAALAALAGCASKPILQVSYERSPTADFAAYQTYAWASTPVESLSERPRSGPDLMNWRIRNAMEKQLAARGYEEAASGRADLSIAYHVRLRDAHTETVQDYIRYSENGGQEGMQEAYTFGYQEGTIIIEVLDAATQRLVWRSTGGPIINPESQQEKVIGAVQSMMAHFPSR